MRMLALIVIWFSSFNAVAGDIEWTGNYRMEGFKLDNPELNSMGRNKAYALHHLTLRPKITAYDGVTINGRFDLMNSDTNLNSAVGQFFGSGVGNATGTPDSSTLSQHQKSDLLAINELYLTYVHDFGMLKVGRVPLHFGLGMLYNAGTGAFDHWFDNRDMASYKFFVTGNVSITPMMAKVAENKIQYGDDINDYMVNVQYENPETELVLGVLYRQRRSGLNGNDIPASILGGTTAQGKFKGDYWNLFFQRWIGELKVGLEAGTQKGQTGVANSGTSIELDGFGVALELDYVPKESSFHYGLKSGVASGDDPTTPNSYEGYIFNRNYDVAMILFNHPLGANDFFRTGAIRSNSSSTPAVSSSEQVDTEAISNVMYFAPYFKYKWSDKFDSQLGLTYAQLSSDPLNVNVNKSVGFEVDVSLTYKPYNGVQWINRVGVFSPGKAFQGGTNQYETKTIYGLETKAAITF